MGCRVGTLDCTAHLYCSRYIRKMSLQVTLAICIVAVVTRNACFVAARFLLSAPRASSPADAAKLQSMASSYRQIPGGVHLPERVFYDPNNGQNNKVEDYIANVYFGEVDLAKADPVLAAAGAAAAAGTQLTYDKSTYFDYESPLSKLNVGPGAKALGTAVARVLGAGSTKAIGRGSTKTNAVYSRNAYDRNNIAVGVLSELAGGASAGVYLDRTSGNDNTDLLEQTPVPRSLVG